MNDSPVWVSLKTATLSIIITFFMGLFLARGVGSIKRKGIRTLLDALLTLPLVLPPTVAGFFLLLIFGIKRPVGLFFFRVFGIKIPFSWGATVLAAVVVSLPLMYRSARGAFAQVDSTVIDAARTLGISQRRIFWTIRLPLALPGVLSGGVLAFARGLGEYGATTMIAGNIIGETRTLPLAVASATAGGNYDRAYHYVGILMVVSFLAVLGMQLFASYQQKAERTESS